MTRDLPTLAGAKALARQLRRDLARSGEAVGHAQALERVAHDHGFRDWNALHAAVATRLPEGWKPGGRVTGSYLSRRFAATVIAAEPQRPGWVRLVLQLDEPVDVVSFASFSNYRRRIAGEVGPEGHSRERTSDGVPHLQLDL